MIVTHMGRCRASRLHGCRVLTRLPFAASGAYFNLELELADVWEIQRVQPAVPDVQRRWHRRYAGVSVQEWRVAAGCSRYPLGKAACGPADERRLANAWTTVDGGSFLMK